MTTQHNCEGERAKLAGEVTEGDRALWESLCRLNACAANVEDYQEESVALIAKFRASVAVAEAVAAVNAQWESWGVIEVAVRNDAVQEYMRHWETRAEQAESKVTALEAENKRLVAALKAVLIHSEAPYPMMNSIQEIAKAALQPAPKV